MKPRRKGTAADRLLAKVRINPTSDCWEWTGRKIKKGYGQMKVDGINRLVHRVSFELHRDRIPVGLLVCHSCDNRVCVNPDHLFLGTNIDNMNDMIAKGRQGKLKGSRNGRSKLVESDVVAIRCAAGIKRRDLAKRYQVSLASIDDICSGRTWRHVGSANG